MITGTARTHIGGLVAITRYTNSLYAAMYTLIGAYLAGGLAAAVTVPAGLAALVVGLTVAYGFVINDYRDVVEDGYQKPQRPIPAGRVLRRDALTFALFLSGGALLLALTLGPLMALVAVGCVAVATLYSFALKGTVLWGNACMASLIAAIPVYGALTTGGVDLRVWIVAGLMWLFDFSHEILKTTADHAGDRRAGLRTVATAFGVPGAVRIFQGAALLFLLVASLPAVLGMAPIGYLLALILCAVLPTLSVVAMLARSTSDATITRALKIMRYMWLSNLIPILILGLPAFSV
jgi:4-hydroxybenzoate polyprenyltransferase